jgi:uncharacterized membrane protein YraQ (UPF0718 family)
VVIGLRKQHASIGSGLAFFLGNPVLNPATLIFMGFVLGWQFSAIRLIVGLLLIALVVTLAERMTGPQTQDVGAPTFEPAPIEQPNRSFGTLGIAWLRELWNEIVAILPGYILIVLLLGGLRAWFFTPDFTLHADGIVGTSLVSLVGALFVIPTAGEVPIVQTLLAHGMSISAAVALIITLPAISLPSLFIVRKVFPAKVLAMTFGIIFAGGVITGTLALLLHL